MCFKMASSTLRHGMMTMRAFSLAEISKVTKKMKDVKVNPAFAATFASLTTLPARTVSGE